MLKDIITVVLAGGAGERLKPLTEVRAKPAVPFGGKYRIIDFTLSNCVNSELYKILVLTQYKSHSLNNHLAHAWSFLPRELNQYIENIPAQQRISESWYLGTADAVRQNIEFIKRENPKMVLILAGDHIYKMDYRILLKFHEENDAELTISALRVPLKKAREFGVMQVDKNQRIITFDEKPEYPKPIEEDPNLALCSMGIYVFNYKTLEEVLNSEEVDFGKHIIPKMIRENKRVYEFDFSRDNKIQEYEFITQDGNRIKVLKERSEDSSYWIDVGTLVAYWRANMDLVGVKPQFSLYGEKWPIHTYQRDYAPTKTVFKQENRRGEALDSLVCDGVIISGAKVQNSVISPGTFIHSYSHISNSVLMGGEPGKETSIGRGCIIRNAIIDKNVEMAKNTIIGFDIDDDRKRGFEVREIETETGTKEHIVVIKKESVIE